MQSTHKLHLKGSLIQEIEVYCKEIESLLESVNWLDEVQVNFPNEWYFCYQYA